MPWHPVDPSTYSSTVTAPLANPAEVFAGPGYTQPPPQKNPLATTSLVLGIVGVPIPFLAILAIIFGHVAAANGRRVGRGVARAGLGLGYLSILAWGVTMLITSGLLFL